MSVSGSALTGGAAAGSSFATPVVTLYSYDALGNLTQVTQGSQTRTFAYDGFSRRVSSTTPEAGTEIAVYDSDASCPSPNSFPGQLVKRLDARGVRTCYRYDALNRLTQKNYSDGTSAVSYTYDQGGAAVFALGRLTSMTDGSGSETYAYDKAGNKTQVTKTVGAQIFSTTIAYNAAGQPTAVTYPSGRVVKYSYDNIGRLSSVADTINGITTTRASGYAYTPSGNVRTFNYGNGVTATYNYSASRTQLASLSYTKGTTTLFGLNYWYQSNSTNCPAGENANNGQINCITDTVDSGRSISLDYDGIGRLTAAFTAGSTNYPQWGLSWSYDRYANRTAQTVTAGSAPSNSLTFPSPNTTNRPVGYSFDASGNLTVESIGSNYNYGYDAEDRMTSVSGGAAATYTYDGGDLRVKKAVTGGATTLYVFAGSQDVAEYDNGAPATSPSREYIYADGNLIATITGSTSVYHHSDHLSVRLTTDSNGNIVGQQGHFPYGETWYAANTTTKFQFTSYEQDPETGLAYAMARYYNPRMGRFCSPDPDGGSPDDPQSWNRYSYARNDPMNVSDRSGRNWLATLIEDIIIAAVEFFSAGTATPAVAAWEGAGASDQLLLSIFSSMASTMYQVQNSLSSNYKPKQQAQAETRCPVQVYVILGNPKTIGKDGGIPHGKDGYGGHIEKDSAAVDPKQWGAKTGVDLRPISDSHGTIAMGKQSVEFKNIRDVIGSKDVTDPATGQTAAGDRAREIIAARHPGTLSIELPGLQKYPGGKKAPVVYPGVIYVPHGTPCPKAG